MRRADVMACVLVCAALAGCRGRDPGATGVPAARVDGQRVVLAASSPQRDALVVDAVTVRQTDSIRLTGRLVWDEERTTRVYSPVGGRVTGLPAGVGQRVAAGAVLAAIASPDYGQAQADVRKADADCLLARRSYTRLQDLFDHGAAARRDLEAAENAYMSAVSEKERAAARLAVYGGSADAAGAGFRLRAPVAGVVVERSVTRGQEVRPDQMLGNVPQAFLPLFVISEPTRLWVVLDATELDMPRLRPGQALDVRTRAYPGTSFRGVLDLVGDELDPATRTIKARGTVANPGRLLKAEMYVTVDVASGAAACVEVPSKAVFRKADTPFVFVEAAPGSYERRAVTLGSEADGRIAVPAGLRAGQRVVTDGCLLLETILESGSKS